MSRALWPATRVAVNLFLIAVAVIGGLWVLGELRVVVVPVLASLLLATLLVPPADFLRRQGWPSALATGVVMIAAAVLLGGLVALIAPAFVDQFDELESSVDEAVNEVVRWLVQGPFDLERSQIDEAVQNGLDSLRQNAGGIGRGVLSGASMLAEVIAGLLLMVVLVFFFVHDGRGMWKFGLSLVPRGRRELVDGAGREAWAATAGYMRGVALIAVVDAALIGIALAVIGVPLVVPLMVLVFLGAFIPLVGAVASGAIAALVALISNGVVDAALVLGAIVVIQQVEGDLLYPNVVGRMIRLHPVAILLVLTAGTVVAGIIGALLAIPAAAAAWTAFRYAREQLDEENQASVVHLLQPGVEHFDAAIAGDDRLAEVLGHPVAPGWATFTEALPMAREGVAADPDNPWGPRFFVAGEPPELVGWGGFKGRPKEGVIELGYEIAEARREQGLATAAAQAMVDEAFADPAITEVIAHTLPERNASNRVLEKLGFRFAEETHEDEQAVWRFSLSRAYRSSG